MEITVSTYLSEDHIPDESINSNMSNGIPDGSIKNNADDEVSELGCCDPSRGVYRFGGLFLMCFLGFGSYFCYDNPGALQNQIKDDMKVDTIQFASLYSLYSWPNVVLCFVGGFLIDRVLGIKMGAIIFSALLTFGQYLVAVGGIVDQFWVMQLGRFIFGIGCESLAVAQNAYAVKWFKGKELNMVFGLLLSMARVGSTVNFLSMGPIYSWVNTFSGGHTALGISLLIAGATCIYSLICAVILGLMDKRLSKIAVIPQATTEYKIKPKDVLSFPLSFWLLSLICVSYYVAIIPFIGLAKIFFVEKYNFSETEANGVCSVVYIISAVASPICGLAVDKLGRNVFWVFIAIVTTLGCHTLLAFTFVNPFIPMSILGISYSLLASSLWPMVSLILPEHTLGTAYGLMQSVQNLGLAVISILAGLIVDQKGYFVLEIFFIMWLSIAVICVVGIWLVDLRNGSVLNKSAKNRISCEIAEEERLLQS